MYDYTTPTLTLTVPNDVNLTQATIVYVTFATDDDNEEPFLNLSSNDSGVSVYAHKVEVFLTQGQTAIFPHRSKIQVNWLYDDGGVTKRMATKKAKITTDTNLLDRVLP